MVRNRLLLHGFTAVAFAWGSTGLAANYGDGCGANLGCAQTTGCNGNQNCGTPCQPPTGATPPNQPQGFFQAPPPTGSVQGATQGGGFQGAEITFPELRLRFPGFRFPEHFRSRTEARMVTDSGIAPFVQGQSVSMGVTVQPNIPVGAPPPQGGPPQGGPPMPCDRPVPTQGAPPACDTRTTARLEALDSERRDLEQRLASLQQLLAQSGGASPGRMEALPTKAESGQIGSLPYATPIRPPASPTQSGAPRVEERRYSAEPAAFVSEEPRRMEFSPPPPIREPQPAPRITGLRMR